MNALILGGESPRHEQWVRDVSAAIQPHFDSVRALYYRHWEAGGTAIDLNYEIGRAADIATGLDQYVVIAKSIGTVVTSLAVSRGLLHPEHCVFLFPLGAVTNKLPEVNKALQALPATAFVHNEFDKVGSATDVRAYLEEVEPPQYSFRMVAGNTTHDYVDFDLITALAIAH